MAFKGNNKVEEINELMRRHFKKIEEALNGYKETVYAYIDEGGKHSRDSESNELAYRVHELENEADFLRRDIQMKLYEGAFLPDLREDYVNLVEMADEIADIAEHTTDNLILMHPDIPEGFGADIKELVDLTMVTFSPMHDLLNYLTEDIDIVLEKCKEVENAEDDVDRKEWRIIRNIFDDSDIETGERVILREIVTSIAMVSNQIEDLSDLMEVMVIKAKV